MAKKIAKNVVAEVVAEVMPVVVGGQFDHLFQVPLSGFHAFWDFESNSPLYNPGRNDKESWGCPEGQIPLEMADGFDLAKGALGALTVEDTKKFAMDFVTLRASTLSPKALATWKAIAENPVAVAMEQRRIRVELLKQDTGVRSYILPKKQDVDDTATETLTVSQRAVADILDSPDLPSLFVFIGQRRTYASPYTVAVHKARHPESTGYLFCVETRKYSGSVGKWHEAIARENNEGARTPYSLIGLAVQAIDFIAENPLYKEEDLGRMLGLSDYVDAKGKVTSSKRGERQRQHRLARLANKFPELNMSARISKEPVVSDKEIIYQMDGYIPVKKLDKEDLQSLLGRAEKPSAAFVEVCGHNKGHVEATAQQCEAYFKMIIEGSKPAKITANTMRTYRESAAIANRMVKLGDVLKAIIENDFNFFQVGTVVKEPEPETKEPATDPLVPIGPATDIEV